MFFYEQITNDDIVVIQTKKLVLPTNPNRGLVETIL